MCLAKIVKNPRLFPHLFPQHPKNSQAWAVQNATFELQTAPGHALAQKGRFGSFPQEKVNSQAWAVQNCKFELQKAPGQDLAQRAASAHSQKRN